MLGSYRHRDSSLHRCAAGKKLLALLLAMLALLQTQQLSVLMGALMVLVALYRYAGFDSALLWQTLRPLRWLLVLLALFQFWQVSTDVALAVCLRFVALIWLASLVTYTTKTQAMTNALCHALVWLKPLGISPKKVAWMLALTLRFVPLWIKINQEIREAHQARGLKPSVKKQITAIIMKTYPMADEIADAIDARCTQPAKDVNR
jgi:biotin transport system permease protein